MARNTNETLDEIVKKLDEAEKEFDEKMNQTNFTELLKKEENLKNQMQH